MELAVTEDPDEVARELDGRLTKEQVEALAAREKSLYGSGGDVAKELPRLRADLEQEVHFRLLPGYVRQYIEQAAPLVDIEIEGDLGGFSLFGPNASAPWTRYYRHWRLYPEKARNRLSVSRPADLKDVDLAPSRRAGFRTVSVLGFPTIF